jgi:hypothetical protein
MSESPSHSERKGKSSRALRTVFLIYGIMVLGLFGFFIVFPDMKSHGTQGGGTPLQTAAKAVRYEAVIANWNRYRAKDARAEVR